MLFSGGFVGSHLLRRLWSKYKTHITMRKFVLPMRLGSRKIRRRVFGPHVFPSSRLSLLLCFGSHLFVHVVLMIVKVNGDVYRLLPLWSPYLWYLGF
ncbi:hypothetical protein V6N13_083059 [Hibiscus sabdariffa]